MNIFKMTHGVRYQVPFLVNRIKEMNLSVTNMCNHMCKTCNIWKTYKYNLNLTEKEVTLKEYEDFFKKHNFWTHLSFTGGEPFLRKDFSNVVKSAVRNCPNLKAVSLNTNGYATDLIMDKTKEIANFSKNKQLHVNISLDGLPEAHNDIRGIKDASKNTMETFKRLQDIKRVNVRFEYTISVYNQGRLKEFMKKSSIPADNMVLTFAQNSYYYGQNAFLACPCPDVDLAKKDVGYFVSRLKPKSMLNIGQWIFLIHYLYGLKIPCVAGKDTFHADAFGDIYLCTLLNIKAGSIKENFLKEVSPPKDCYCYIPCESYYGLMKHKSKSLLKALGTVLHNLFINKGLRINFYLFFLFRILDI